MSRPGVVGRIGAVQALLWPFGRRHRRHLGVGFLSTIALVLCRLAFPIPLKGIVELSVPSSAKGRMVVDLLPTWGDPVLWLSAGAVGLAVLGGLAEHFQRLSFARFTSRSLNDARMAAMTSIGAPEGRKRDPGTLVACIVADSARVKQGLKGLLNHVTANGLLFLTVCGVLLATDVRLGLIQLAGGAVVTVIALFGASRVAGVAERHRAGEGDLADAVHRALLGGGDDSHGGDFEDVDAASGVADIEMSRWEGRTTCAVQVTLTVMGGALLWIGLRAVDAGRMATGDLVAVVAYLLILHEPTVRLARQVARLGPVLASAERLAPFLRPEPRADDAALAAAPADPERVSLPGRPPR